MADFVAVLKKTIEGLSDNSPAMREKVYRKARETVAAKLNAIQPPPSRIVVDRQHKALEDAIAAVEASYAVEAPASDDFEMVLAGLGRTEAEPAKPEIAHETPAFTRIEPAEPATAADLISAPKAVDRPDKPGENEGAVANGNGLAAEDEFTPIAPAPRREPEFAERLAGDKPVSDETADGALGDNRRRISGGMIAAAIAIVIVAAAGYGIWANRDDLGAMLGLGDTTVVEQPADAEQPAEAEPETEMAAVPAEPGESETPATPEAAARPAQEEVTKFTQRLTPDGQEVDEGPAEGQASVGEGTSMAAATQPGEEEAPAAATSEQATPPQTASETAQPVPVGQKAIFYEERTNVAQGSADTGSTVWSVVQESPGGDLPPEPAIRAEVTVPSKDLQLRMTIRRNGDKSLPASHIVEMIFLTSGTFEGGGIDNVLRIALKSSEAAPGNPLIGIPAKIADGYFLVALSDGQAEQETNTQLLLRQSWIDIPIVYRSGRRALVTMEKGVPGDRVFQEAIQAWRDASSG